MDDYEHVGKLVPEVYHYDGGVGSIQIEVFRCLICFCLVDKNCLEDHRNICFTKRILGKTINNFPMRVNKIYPWEDWFDGRIWQLTQGEDWDKDKPNPRSANVFRKQIQNYASSNEYIIETRTGKRPNGKEVVLFKATKK